MPISLSHIRYIIIFILGINFSQAQTNGLNVTRKFTETGKGKFKVNLTITGNNTGGFGELEEIFSASCKVEVEKSSKYVSRFKENTLKIVFPDFVVKEKMEINYTVTLNSDSLTVRGLMFLESGPGGNEIMPAYSALVKKKEEVLIASTEKEKLKETAKEQVIRTPPQVYKADTSGITFRVQIAASTRPIALNELYQKLPAGEKIYEDFIDGYYKYTINNTRNPEEALTRQRSLGNAGFKGPFVVAYQNGKRIRLQEAMQLVAHK